MTQLTYNGSFDGLLTSVFDIYYYNYTNVSLSKDGDDSGILFGNLQKIVTDKHKSDRVKVALRKKLSHEGYHNLYKTFLSEQLKIENVLLRYIRYVLDSNALVEQDYSNEDVLTVQQTSRFVHREMHRMEAFVRFQLTGDNIYYSIVEPDCNVLPLIADHFARRYADQRWLIYDSKRKYGIYYDLTSVTEITLTFDDITSSGTNVKSIYNDGEEIYQTLWKQYFSSVNIASRKNPKLHLRHLPKRYWKYLTEKQTGW